MDIDWPPFSPQEQWLWEVRPGVSGGKLVVNRECRKGREAAEDGEEKGKEKVVKEQCSKYVHNLR